MEQNPCEAIKNNVVGTATVARAAIEHGVDRFILISTDKAVNPSSVMGASKRIAEQLLQHMNRHCQTRFAAVRFGNVLGSNGSVLPRFIEQIKGGGPVTVTHPDMRRYFMLIPEAVQLVLHAATLGEPGMTYVLEMGEQIKLVDLARHLIRLSGYTPDKEVPITFIGLRPGEKLYEELVAHTEVAEPSPIPKILRVRGNGDNDLSMLDLEIKVLVEAAHAGSPEAVLEQLRRMLPTFANHSSAPVPVTAVSAMQKVSFSVTT
jgi:FlaA1/EpsC-like NDP-sugar epimerase